MPVKQSSRQEHLAWCKKRAFEYVDVGDTDQAFASFMSDVRKHPETESIGHTIAILGMPLKMMGALDSPEEMRKHIDGYN